MQITVKVLLACLIGVGLSGNTYCQKKSTKHFIYFGKDRERIHDAAFYANPNITGAQIRYAWRQLERQKDEYDFSEIEEDIKFLNSKGKKLFIQVQDATFSKEYHAVPQYLISDTTYHGGEVRQCEEMNNGELACHGYVARRWDPKVTERFHKLLQKLGMQLDGRIEGINLPETSIDVSSKRLPGDFSDEIYTAAIKRNMKVTRDCFKKSVPILYANFMPGGQKFLKELYDYAGEINMGMGGPDIKVYKAFQMANSYPLISAMSDKIVTGVAVQDGNYDEINGKTRKKVTVPGILDFAENYLKLDYVFWCTEEPYYSKEVLPLLKKL